MALMVLWTTTAAKSCLQTTGTRLVRVRRCLAAAIKKIDQALEYERPVPTTAEGFVKLRACASSSASG
jgi:hypothetical protein